MSIAISRCSWPVGQASGFSFCPAGGHGHKRSGCNIAHPASAMIGPAPAGSIGSIGPRQPNPSFLLTTSVSSPKVGALPTRFFSDTHPLTGPRPSVCHAATFDRIPPRTEVVCADDALQFRQAHLGSACIFSDGNPTPKGFHHGENNGSCRAPAESRPAAADLTRRTAFGQRSALDKASPFF